MKGEHPSQFVRIRPFARICESMGLAQPDCSYLHPVITGMNSASDRPMYGVDCVVTVCVDDVCFFAGLTTAIVTAKTKITHAAMNSARSLDRLLCIAANNSHGVASTLLGSSITFTNI